MKLKFGLKILATCAALTASVSASAQVGADAWTIAILPDTQNMSLTYPEVFDRQTEWLVANKGEYNIQFVLHEGDIVNNNSHPEWQAARAAMDRLRDARLPFVMVPGNHDMGDWGMANTRRSHFSDYFIPQDVFGSTGFGTFEAGKMDNTWRTFDTPWGPFLIMALEFGPRDAVVEWAAQVAAEKPDHRAILLTHAYLFSDGTRYDWSSKGDTQTWNPYAYGVANEPGGVNDGEQLWNKLVSPNENFFMTLNGHVLNDGVDHLCSERDTAGAVHQMLANYQSSVEPRRGFGGGGFLRLMTFQPDGQTVEIKTYSPWYDEWLTTPEQQFTLRVDPWLNGVAPASGSCGG